MKKAFFSLFFAKFLKCLMFFKSGVRWGSCKTLKSNQICQKVGEKWRKKPRSTCFFKTPFVGWFQVPENPISDTPYSRHKVYLISFFPHTQTSHIFGFETRKCDFGCSVELCAINRFWLCSIHSDSLQWYSNQLWKHSE